MRYASGFTLIELMITVVIIAVLSAIALPSYTDYVTRSKLAEAYAHLSDLPFFDWSARTTYDVEVAQTGQSRSSLDFQYHINGGRLELIDPAQMFDGMLSTVGVSIFAIAPGFSGFLWNFVDGKPLQNKWDGIKKVPAETPMSQALSKELKKRGFTFCGPTIVYAFAQAVGMVNDHTTECFRHKECAKLARR